MKRLLFLVMIVVLIFSIAFGWTGCKVAPPTEEEAVEEATAAEETTEEAVEEATAAEEASEVSEKADMLDEYIKGLPEYTVSGEKTQVWKIGWNNYAESHEFCFKVSNGIKETAKEYGLELEYTESLMDGAKMIANTQTLLDKGCDLIIDFNWVPSIGAQMLQMCNAEGVKLISMDTMYENTYYFGADSYRAGLMNGKYMSGVVIDKWGGKVDAFVGVYLMSGGEDVKNRVKGVVDYMSTAEGIEFPPDDMVFYYDAGTDQISFCKQLATDILTANPDLKHILFATHNDETATGIFAGIEASERKADCLIVSTCGDTPFQEHIRNIESDVWPASCAFAPETYGSKVIPMAIDILEGKDVPMSVFVDHYILTKDNIDEHYPVK